MNLKIGGYQRVVKQRSNGIEAVELTWPCGARTPKHNHHSHGWIWILKGSLFEVRDGKKTYYTAGASFVEVPDGTSHIVGNDSELAAISFHVYQPELLMDLFEDDAADLFALYGAAAEASR